MRFVAILLTALGTVACSRGGSAVTAASEATSIAAQLLIRTAPAAALSMPAYGQRRESGVERSA